MLRLLLCLVLLGGWSTYTNEAAGYAFDYPPGWSVQVDSSGTLFLTSFVLGSLPPGTVPGDETKLDFLTPQPIEESLDDLFDRLLADPATLHIRRIDVDDGPSGVLVYRFSELEDRKTAAFYADQNGERLRVFGYGYLVEFERIMRTLRPA